MALFHRQVDGGTSLFAAPEPDQVPGEVVYRHGNLADGYRRCWTHGFVFRHLPEAHSTSTELGRAGVAWSVAGFRLGGTEAVPHDTEGKHPRASRSGRTARARPFDCGCTERKSFGLRSCGSSLRPERP